MSDEYAADVRHGWLILVNPTVMLRRTSKIRYTAARPERCSRKPNQLLVEAVRHRKPGTALDVGMGQGRNAIFLAKEGWEVTGFDSADEGVRHSPSIKEHAVCESPKADLSRSSPSPPHYTPECELRWQRSARPIRLSSRMQCSSARAGAR
jgi:hypothetical protein